MLKGYLKIIILRELTKKSLSGYALSRRIEEMVNVKPSPGSLYPMLNDLLVNEFIKTVYESGNKKVYTITKNGKKLLKELTEEKDRFIKSQERILRIVKSMDSSNDVYYNEVISFNKNLAKENKFLFKNMDLIIELKSILNRVLTFKKLDSEKERKVRKILKDTINKLSRLYQENGSD